MQSEEAMQIIEGILLTAASFDQQVQFENRAGTMESF